MISVRKDLKITIKHLIKMSKLKYRIENCLEQTAEIKKEHPNVYCVSFDLKECSYSELKEVADEHGKTIVFKDGKGFIHFTIRDTLIFFETVKLLISEPVIIEE